MRAFFCVHPQIGIDRCPSSSMPYFSVSCRGAWCTNFMRPCSRAPVIAPNTPDCSDTAGLICRKPWPGSITDVPGAASSNAGQLLDWLQRMK